MNREKFRWIEQKRSIVQHLGTPDHKDVTQAGIGEDYSRLALCSKDMSVQTPELVVTMGVCLPDAMGQVTTGVIKQYNKLAFGGYEPFALTDTILMPKKDEQEMKHVLQELTALAKELSVDVVCGDTKISEQVSSPVVTVTMTGRKEKSNQNDARVCPDMDVVMCGQTGILGTLLRVRMKKEALLGRYSAEYLKTAERFDRLLIAKDQGRLAFDAGAVYAHHISTDGVYGALWELAEAGRVGLCIEQGAIPIMQETIEICEFTGENPYRIDGCGAALFVTLQGEALSDLLYAHGYEAAVIGRTTADRDRVLLHDDERSYLEPA